VNNDERGRRHFKPPFRFENGYIWDADGEMVADNRPEIDDPPQPDATLRVRGWGRMKYEKDSEQLYQAVGRAIADALTRGWTPQADAIKKAVDKERERCLAPLREWFIDVRPPGDDEDEGPTCAKCAVTVTVGYGLEWEDGDVCDTCAADLFQVVAKLLRDSGAPAPGAGGEGGK